MKNLIIIIFCLISVQAVSQDNATEGAYIYDFERKYLQEFITNGTLIVDHVSQSGFEVYGPQGLLKFLRDLKIPHRDLNEDILLDSNSNYPSPEEINLQLYDLAKRFPNIIHVFSIGQSVQGRDILAVKISDNVYLDEVEPEFKYISSMHGDEITGRELMVLLIQDLAQNYQLDSRITQLIDNTEIYIVPSMNPDGSARKRRGNANNIDLNRNFPDFSTADNQNSLSGRQIETQNIMQFQQSRNFALSANYHGGAAVMNYAWDTIGQKHPFYDLLVEMSLEYANLTGYFRNSEFPTGITNGYEWYEVNGGMQDWSYYWHNDLQFTVEVSIPKWPQYSEIPTYYQYNREAMIRFMSNIHRGAGVGVYNSDGILQTPGKVQVLRLENGQFIDFGTYSISRAEFYKVLPNGEYQMNLYLDNGIQSSFRVAVDGSLSNYSFLELK